MSDDIYTSDSERSPSFGRWAGELLLMVGLAFVFAMGIRTYVVMPYTIPTGSMIPTIEIGDRVLANKFIYRFQDPTSGDIVVFDDPTGTADNLIKRVIAVGGQEVDVHDGRVYVDSVPVEEPYTHGAITEIGDVLLPLVIPEDHIWVMGDNRTNSTDSRFFGPQPMANVYGKAFLRVWPLSRIAPL
ncbi:MAG: signal peptidase I [Coriobacteriia bacterium]|nr:signal peptidase I [Coriobacteriia bacterium]